MTDRRGSDILLENKQPQVPVTNNSWNSNRSRLSKFRTPMHAQSEETEHIVVDDVAEDSDEEHECRVCRGPAEEG